MPEGDTATLTEADDAYCLTDAEIQRALKGAAWQRYGVLGDSLAEGLGEDSSGYLSRPWADRVRDGLAAATPGLEYHNIGLRSLTADQVREQQLDRMLEWCPDLVALTAGGNDLFARRFDPDGIEATLEETVGALRAGGAQVITYGLMDITRTWPQLTSVRPRMETLNARMQAVADRHDTIHVDMWSHAICSQRSAFSADMKHPSMRGHAILAAETVKAIGRRLSPIPTSTRPIPTTTGALDD